MIKKKSKAFMPVLLFFIILNAILLSGKTFLARWAIDREVVIIGNVLLFLVTLLSFNMGLNGLKSTNPHAFVRSVYTSILIKLFGCAIAAFIYIAAAGKSLNKPALFTCMALYLVYSFMEVSILTKLLKEKNHE